MTPKRYALVPADFEIPNPPHHALFSFEPLGPEHNASDLEAWSSSIEHIRATPGFTSRRWPERPYTLEENLADLETHRDHHLRRIDFAWTVLDAAQPGVVVGCVYLERDPTGLADAAARSWVRADRSDLDPPLREHLGDWFAAEWPLSIRYAC